MTELSPAEVASRLGSGLLSFPVTTFTQELAFDEPAYRDHLSWLAEYEVAGLFAAGGTGEFFSLTPNEVERVVSAAVAEVGGRVPVLAPAGMSTSLSIAQARAAEAAGADGILLFPPYLTEVAPVGLVEHVSRVCEATGLGVVLYNRANCRLDVASLERLADAAPNLIGLKDGIGDLESMVRIVATLGDRFIYVGGLPTAELVALPYTQLGATTYSSAIFNFVPRLALEIFDAVRRRDEVAVYAYLRDFVIPFAEIRDRQPGYAVSIIKAGLTAVGRYGGPVRPPLTDLTTGERHELFEIIERSVDLASARQ